MFFPQKYNEKVTVESAESEQEGTVGTLSGHIEELLFLPLVRFHEVKTVRNSEMCSISNFVIKHRSANHSWRPSSNQRVKLFIYTLTFITIQTWKVKKRWVDLTLSWKTSFDAILVLT